MNFDRRLLDAALIASDARQTRIVGFREPDTDAVHLRTVRIPVIPEEDHKGKQQRPAAKPGRHRTQVRMRHGQRG
jgi:hypothetical protein